MAKKHQQKKRKKQKQRKGNSSRKQSSDQNQRKVAKTSCFQVAAKFGTQEENRVDILSNLPNEILQNIISLLPTQAAAQTMLLSTQWRELWNMVSIQRGSIQDMGPVTASFLDLVDWDNPLSRPWKLQFYTEVGIAMVATTGANNRLHMNFPCIDSDPRWRFYLDLELSDHNLKCLPSPSTFVVKSLCLKSVNHLSSDTISSMLLHLHFLESIEIRECDGIFGMSVNGGSKLKHLSIIDCYQLESVTILAHTLESFRCQGPFPEIFMVGLSSFEDIMLDFREGPGYEDFQCSDSHSLLILFLKEARHITLCQWTFEVMIKPRLHLKDPDVQFNNLKELWWIDNYVDEEKIDSLISFVGACPALEKLFVTIDPISYGLMSKRNGSSQVKISKTRLRHLKMVKMAGFPCQEDELLLADCILKVATREPIITASSYYSDPRNRSVVNINPKRKKFVEEIDSRVINARHMHMSV